jgi:hypothetical protein
MAGTTIKLQTNIPVIGTITYCDFIKSKNTAPDGTPYSDQISLRGTWDGAGEGRMYLHLSIEQELKNLGVIGDRQANGNCPLLLQAPKVKVTKIEQGTAKRTVVELLGHAGALAQQVQQHTQQQQSLYPPANLVSIPPKPLQPNATVADLTTTLADSMDLARQIYTKFGAGEEFTLAAMGTALFEQRCRLGLYGKTENVPF